MSTTNYSTIDGLRPDQIRAGFSFDRTSDDHCVIIWRNSIRFARYGRFTAIDIIHRDIDQAIELSKAASMEPFRVEDFQKETTHAH